MPNIWTHIFFAEDACKSLSYDIHDSPYRHTLFLGAQGPDPFFYYQFWPWLSAQKTGHDIGNALHTKECGPFLMYLIEKANKQSDETKAYVTGFITHHFLDRHTHPYIHYRAGYQGNKHQMLETIIDTRMALKHRQMEIWKHPAYAEIFVGKTLPPAILNLLDEAIQNIYPEHVLLLFMYNLLRAYFYFLIFIGSSFCLFYPFINIYKFQENDSNNKEEDKGQNT